MGQRANQRKKNSLVCVGGGHGTTGSRHRVGLVGFPIFTCLLRFCQRRPTQRRTPYNMKALQSSKRRSSRGKGEVNEIKARLDSLSGLDGRRAEVVAAKRETFQKLIKHMTTGIDTSSLFVGAMKCCALSKQVRTSICPIGFAPTRLARHSPRLVATRARRTCRSRRCSICICGRRLDKTPRCPSSSSSSF